MFNREPNPEPDRMARFPRTTRDGFRTLYESGRIADASDGQLLERYASAPGEASERAFAAIVERHGPLVLRACRLALRDEHDAEDVFQATFLVLARKARSLWVRDSLGPWLLGVAGLAACKLRKARARRRAREAGPRTLEQIPSRDRDGSDELASAFFEELARLPERFRAPVVLCDLQGKDQESAARSLGCPIGTIKSRLARGRAKLRDRLARRGYAPALGFSAAIVADSARATPIFGLARAIADASRLAHDPSGPVLVTAEVSTLARSTLGAMSMPVFLRISLVALASVAVAGPPALWIAIQDKAAGNAAASPDDPPPGAPSRLDDPAAEPEAPLSDVDVTKAGPAPIRATITVRGRVEASEAAVLKSEVEGRTTIVSLIPEGTPVKKGELVCNLDTSALQDQATDQKIAVALAQTAFMEAKLEKKLAEVEQDSYQHGTFPTQTANLEGRLDLARLEHRVAEDEVARVTKVDPNSAEAAQARLSEARAQLHVDEAERSLRILKNFRHRERMAELAVAVEKSKYEFLAAEQVYVLKQDTYQKTRRNINKCSIYAPFDGVVSYAKSEFGPEAEPIREGASVREQQRIVSIIKLGEATRMVVEVPEAFVDRVSPGQKASILVQSFPARTGLSGVVERVAPTLDPIKFFKEATKFYTTRIRIDQPGRSIRPGTSGEVEIELVSIEAAVAVPLSAVMGHDPSVVFVQAEDGGFHRRPVELGTSDGKLIEVRSGLVPNEIVASDVQEFLRLNPQPAKTQPETPVQPDPAEESSKPLGDEDLSTTSDNSRG